MGWEAHADQFIRRVLTLSGKREGIRFSDERVGVGRMNLGNTGSRGDSSNWACSPQNPKAVCKKEERDSRSARHG